jgi:capsid protein
LLAANWLPTKWDWVDPLKDANAEIAQIEAGLKSRTQAIAERGYDAEQVDREIAAERERERLLGLDFHRPGSPAQGVEAVPDDDDATDSADDNNQNNAAIGPENQKG